MPTPIDLPDITNDSASPSDNSFIDNIPPWAWAGIGAGAMLALILLGLAWSRFKRRRRRRLAAEAMANEAAASPQPAASPIPARPTTPARPRAASTVDPTTAGTVAPLELRFNPTSAGTNVTDALVEFVLTINNPGGIAAEDMTIAAWLRSGHAQQDAEVRQLLAAPPAPGLSRSVLGAGGTRRIETRLTLPKRRIHVLNANGRPFFVPLVVVDLRYRSAGLRRIGAAFLVGTPGGADGRLGPIFLDRGPEMLHPVQGRLHGSIVE